MRTKRRNGYRKLETARDRERRWARRCLPGGLTLDKLAERTGHAPDVLAFVLRSEAQRRRRRVWLDADGREARHTAITDLLRRTGNLKLAQMLAGHADIGTTANIYAHLDTTDLETALRALNEAPR
jgi:integrase